MPFRRRGVNATLPPIQHLIVALFHREELTPSVKNARGSIQKNATRCLLICKPDINACVGFCSRASSPAISRQYRRRIAKLTGGNTPMVRSSPTKHQFELYGHRQISQANQRRLPPCAADRDRRVELFRSTRQCETKLIFELLHSPLAVAVLGSASPASRFAGIANSMSGGKVRVFGNWRPPVHPLRTAFSAFDCIGHPTASRARARCTHATLLFWFAQFAAFLNHCFHEPRRSPAPALRPFSRNSCRDVTASRSGPTYWRSNASVPGFTPRLGGERKNAAKINN